MHGVAAPAAGVSLPERAFSCRAWVAGSGRLAYSASRWNKSDGVMTPRERRLRSELNDLRNRVERLINDRD